jgi:hypothetical protein
MKRLPIPHLVLAAAMALLLPIAQLHCTCMGSQTHAAPVASHDADECCDSPAPVGADHSSHHQQTPQPCSCPSMGTAVVPVAIAIGPEAPTVAPLAFLIVPVVIAPAPIVTETIPALDVGSPPLPDDPGAHGLRAPPATA